jgi:hypothetical protein
MGVMNGIVIIRTPAMPVKGEGGLEFDSFSTFLVQHPCQEDPFPVFFPLPSTTAGAYSLKGLLFQDNLRGMFF